MTCKVLMFGWEFPPQFNGGLGIACHGLTSALAKDKNLDVTLVLPKLMPVDKTIEKFVFADQYSRQSGSITLTQINSLLSAYSTYNVYSSKYQEVIDTQHSGAVPFAPDLIGEVYRYAARGSQIASEAEYDIIHAHDWLTIPAALEAKKAINKSFILHIHATEIDRTGGHVDQRIYDIERMGMEEANTIVAVSEHTRNVIVKHYGISPDKIKAIHNGINYDEFKYAQLCTDTTRKLQAFKDQGYQIVLFVGRLTMQKGAENLLKSAKKVIDAKPKTLFIIAGHGELQNKLISLSAKLKMSGNIIFAGWVEGKQRTTLYAMADLFVMPSVSEPFGLVSLEAAAHDTPIILSKTSGVGEIIKHSIATDFWDIDTTSDMIFSVLEYPALQTLLAQGASKEARQNTWDLTARKLTQTYMQHIN